MFEGAPAYITFFSKLFSTGIDFDTLGCCKKGVVTQGAGLVGNVGLITCWVAGLFAGWLTCDGLDPRGILDNGSSYLLLVLLLTLMVHESSDVFYVDKNL